MGGPGQQLGTIDREPAVVVRGVDPRSQSPERIRGSDQGRLPLVVIGAEQGEPG